MGVKVTDIQSTEGQPTHSTEYTALVKRVESVEKRKRELNEVVVNFRDLHTIFLGPDPTGENQELIREILHSRNTEDGMYATILTDLSTQEAIDFYHRLLDHCDAVYASEARIVPMRRLGDKDISVVAKDDLESVTDSLSETDGERSDAAGQVAFIPDPRNDLPGYLDALTGELEGAYSEILRLRTDLRSTNAELTESKKNYKGILDKFKEKAEESSQYQKDYEESRGREMSLISDLKALKTEYAVTTEDLQRARENVARSSSVLETLKGVVSDAERPDLTSKMGKYMKKLRQKKSPNFKPPVDDKRIDSRDYRREKKQGGTKVEKQDFRKPPE
ncbi:hypothetical protein ACFLZN_02060 [Nanoarchaeota archaeon]